MRLPAVDTRNARPEYISLREPQRTFRKVHTDQSRYRVRYRPHSKSQEPDAPVYYCLQSAELIFLTCRCPRNTLPPPVCHVSARAMARPRPSRLQLCTCNRSSCQQNPSREPISELVEGTYKINAGSACMPVRGQRSAIRRRRLIPRGVWAQTHAGIIIEKLQFFSHARFAGRTEDAV